MGKIQAKFKQKRLNLGKIEILHPQKHLVSYGYVALYLKRLQYRKKKITNTNLIQITK